MPEPAFETKYPVSGSDCMEGIKSNVVADEKQVVTTYLAYAALVEYVPVIFYPTQRSHATLKCIGGDEVDALVEEYMNTVKELARKFSEYIHMKDFTDAIEGGKIQEARRRLDDIVESLKSLGLTQHAVAFRVLNETALTESKRGNVRKVDEAVTKAAEVISRAEYEYVLRELSRKYMVLWFGNYAIVLLKPPAPGFHEVPTDYVQLMEALARLFPGDVNVSKNPDDEDAAFAVAIWRVKNKDYIRHIMRVYLEHNGITPLNAPGAYLLSVMAPGHAIYAMKTIKNGCLTNMITVGDDLYIIKYPKIKLKSSGDKTKDFEEILTTLMNMAP